MKADIQVSIVIPVFNKVDFTRRCLEALSAHTPSDLYELIVVDNASTDGTRDLLGSLEGDAHVITNGANLGFGKACNQGAAAAKGKYLLFLNNDTEPQPGWLEPLISLLDNEPDVAAVGCKLLFPDGTLQHAGVMVVENQVEGRPLDFQHRFYRLPADHPEAQVRADVQVVTGAAFLLRSNLFFEHGGFDESFWNGNEDVDLCLKLGAEGWRIVYEPSSCLIHHESVSGPERWSHVNENIKLLLGRWIGKVTPEILMTPDGRMHVHPLRRERSGEPKAVPPSLTSIVMLTFNQLEVTQLCVNSLYRYTRNFELVIVDNASTDGTVAYLEALANAHDNVKLILNRQNRGFAGGCNQGMALAAGRHVVLLNNDTVVSEGWLDGLLAVVECEGVGIVGPRTNCIVGPQQVEAISYDPITLEGFEDFAREWRERSPAVWRCYRVIGFCMLIRREVIDRIGGLDTSFGTGNFEDDDYCLRAVVAGFTIAVTDAVFIHHFGSVTFKGQNIDYRRTMEANWAKFKRKWGLPEVLPLESGYRPADIIDRSFDPTRHAVPLFCADTAPAELPNRRAFTIVLADGDEPRIMRSLVAYLDAFQEGDDVSLLLISERRARMHALVDDVLRTRDPLAARIPEISLMDAPASPLELPGILRAADLVLGDPAIVEGARDMGIPACVEPDAEFLRIAKEHFSQLDWSARTAAVEIDAKERWLTTESWEIVLEAYLGAVKADQDVALLVGVPAGSADEVQGAILEWLVQRGHDPERIPDVTVLDLPSEAELFRQATAWVDTGDAVRRAMAQASGIRVIVPSAMPQALDSIFSAPSR